MDIDQLNIDMESSALNAAKRDAVKTNAKLKVYVAEALLHFRRSLPLAERRKRFEDPAKQKTLGRPVSA